MLTRDQYGSGEMDYGGQMAPMQGRRDSWLRMTTL